MDTDEYDRRMVISNRIFRCVSIVLYFLITMLWVSFGFLYEDGGVTLSDNHMVFLLRTMVVFSISFVVSYVIGLYCRFYYMRWYGL